MRIFSGPLAAHEDTEVIGTCADQAKAGHN